MFNDKKTRRRKWFKVIEEKKTRYVLILVCFFFREVPAN